MRGIRRILLGFLVLAVSACSGSSTGPGSGAKDADTTAKLIGDWECVTDGPEKGRTVKFMKDGRVETSLSLQSMTGTYTVSGPTLSTTFQPHLNKPYEKKTAIIETLTDDELVLKEDNKQSRFKRK